MSRKTTVRKGAWRVEWEGGRLADVFHDECDGAVECIQAGPYDWERDKSLATRATLKTALSRFVREDGQTCIKNVVIYR